MTRSGERSFAISESSPGPRLQGAHAAYVSDGYQNRGEITPDDVVRELSNFGPNDVPIIVVDEFNEVSDPATPRLMANAIKGLSDAGVNATVIVVGVADDVNELIAGHESISRCCEEVLMPRMGQHELRDVIDLQDSAPRYSYRSAGYVEDR